MMVSSLSPNSLSTLKHEDFSYLLKNYYQVTDEIIHLNDLNFVKITHDSNNNIIFLQLENFYKIYLESITLANSHTNLFNFFQTLYDQCFIDQSDYQVFIATYIINNNFSKQLLKNLIILTKMIRLVSKYFIATVNNFNLRKTYIPDLCLRFISPELLFINFNKDLCPDNFNEFSLLKDFLRFVHLNVMTYLLDLEDGCFDSFSNLITVISVENSKFNFLKFTFNKKSNFPLIFDYEFPDKYFYLDLDSLVLTTCNN